MGSWVRDSSYVIIIPVRDEEKYLHNTLDSIVNQTIRPLEVVIVNDGSTDRTGEIIDDYAKKYQWITPVHLKNRGYRQAGTGVINAFYEGYHRLQNQDWEFIVKLDGDLGFQNDYFEKCFEIFHSDPKLGIGGGDIYNLVDGKPKHEKQPRFHVRGATKIYKKECWKALGNLLAAPGWDTLDEVKANMLGWTTYSFPHLKIIHYRFTGAADGAWRNAVKNGLSDYICGYHPFFMTTKCIKSMIKKPYLLTSAGLMYGFLSGYVKKTKHIDDQSLIKYLRNQQLRRVFLKPSIWQ